MAHKAGFVSIIGKPNAGKSTLMNALIGESLSVVNPKAQTTRHRIMGILNADDYQVVFSDTPGMIEPAYKLQERMMTYVSQALGDADVILLVDDLTAEPLETDALAHAEVPVIVALNKADLASTEKVETRATYYRSRMKPLDVVTCSALKGERVDDLRELIIGLLPVHPPYYAKDEMTDKSVRFFTAEIIRGKILSHYHQEVPYACEVAIESFTEEPSIARIRALIFVERESQKIIMIGRKGEMLKKVGTEARLDIERLVGTKVFLELHVKVREKWRQKDELLDHFGY